MVNAGGLYEASLDFFGNMNKVPRKAMSQNVREYYPS